MNTFASENSEKVVTQRSYTPAELKNRVHLTEVAQAEKISPEVHRTIQEIISQAKASFVKELEQHQQQYDQTAVDFLFEKFEELYVLAVPAFGLTVNSETGPLIDPKFNPEDWKKNIGGRGGKVDEKYVVFMIGEGLLKHLAPISQLLLSGVDSLSADAKQDLTDCFASFVHELAHIRQYQSLPESFLERNYPRLITALKKGGYAAYISNPQETHANALAIRFFKTLLREDGELSAFFRQLDFEKKFSDVANRTLWGILETKKIEKVNRKMSLYDNSTYRGRLGQIIRRILRSSVRESELEKEDLKINEELDLFGEKKKFVPWDQKAKNSFFQAVKKQRSTSN